MSKNKSITKKLNPQTVTTKTRAVVPKGKRTITIETADGAEVATIDTEVSRMDSEIRMFRSLQTDARRIGNAPAEHVESLAERLVEAVVAATGVMPEVHFRMPQFKRKHGLRETFTLRLRVGPSLYAEPAVTRRDLENVVRQAEHSFAPYGWPTVAATMARAIADAARKGP